MIIKYLAHSCFLLTTNAGTRIVTDPYDPGAYPGSLKYRPLDEPADVVTLSHDHADHGRPEMVPGSPVVIKGNGKFIADGVEFLGVATYHDEVRGSKRGANTVFIISADGIRLAHMGDLGHVLTADQAADIGAVDVALIPVGGYYTVDAAQAHTVAEQLQAKIIIPMHYRTAKCGLSIAPVESFIEGKPNVTCEAGSTIEIIPATLPESPRIVVLDHSL